MKTLVHSILWCPKNQPLRQAGIEKHLDAFTAYEGEFDIHITVNDFDGLSTDRMMMLSDNRQASFDFQKENKGWAWARNSAMIKAEEYDLLIMMDGDIWVKDNQWIVKAQQAAKVQPVFMCRMSEPQFRAGGKMRLKGFSWDLYDEWLGCINVATKEVLQKVGGYNLIDLPNAWGFHDCEWGRRLAKADLLKAFGGFYPSLSNLDVIEEQEAEYDKFLDPVKHECLRQYTRKFWEMDAEIRIGKRPVFFDYRINQDEN